MAVRRISDRSSTANQRRPVTAQQRAPYSAEAEEYPEPQP